MRDRNPSSLTERNPGNVEAVIGKFEPKADPATAKPRSGTQNMVDRLDALEGIAEGRSTVGKGTTVTGTLPVRVLEPVS